MGLSDPSFPVNRSLCAVRRGFVCLSTFRVDDDVFICMICIEGDCITQAKAGPDPVSVREKPKQNHLFYFTEVERRGKNTRVSPLLTLYKSTRRLPHHMQEKSPHSSIDIANTPSPFLVVLYDVWQRQCSGNSGGGGGTTRQP